MEGHTKPVRIAALGMERRTYSTLQLFFHGHCKDNYVLVEEKSADISIIDMDGFQACRMLEEHKKHYPNQPAILISLSDKKTLDAVYVRKPIQLEALSSALSRAKEKLQQPMARITPQLQIADSECGIPPVLNEVVHNPQHDATLMAATPANITPVDVTPPNGKKPGFKQVNQYRYSAGSLSDDTDLELLNIKPTTRFNPHNPIQTAQYQYQPQQTLQGYFQQAYFMALQQQRNVVLKGPWRPITILHKSKQLRVEKNFRHLYALSGMFFNKSEVSITVLDDSVNCEPSLHETVLFAEPFLWKLSMRTSRGRVPEGTDFTVPIKLIRWPNFTRTIVTPHALRIAALWAKRPTSLIDTASYLAIPLQYVFLFYTATASLNFVAAEAPEKNNPAAPTLPVKRHKYRTIFQALLERLRNN